MASKDKEKGTSENAVQAAQTRLATHGRNDPCSCGSGKKYKKCHLRQDESATVVEAEKPDPDELTQQGFRMLEQRRPGAAEKQFRAVLELNADHINAKVGIGFARLSAGDQAEATQSFEAVIAHEKPLADKLRKDGVKNAFERIEAQPFIRAAHALGCMCYDDGDFEKSVSTLETVYSVDEGAIGTEARLVAAKALVKLQKASEAVPLLQAAARFDAAAARAEMGLALAQLVAGDTKQAEEALERALTHNPHMGKAILGQLKKGVDNPAAALPGTREEAAFYAQSFGDAWDDTAKDFLRSAIDKRMTAAQP